MSNKLHFKIQPGGKLTGQLRVPGDKSISHRAIMLGALADGITHIEGFLTGEDCLATLHAFQKLGVKIVGPNNGQVEIYGVGLNGLKAPHQALDMGNSGTAMRLMTGILAAQPFDSRLIGDESLSKRPMKRIADPLAQMGTKMQLREGSFPPIDIFGGQHLHGISYRMPIASAQVKSCLLLAGLYAEGQTSITEPVPSRDHTERMLQAYGADIQQINATVFLKKTNHLKATPIQVPADISSAAFFMVGASIAKNSDITLHDIGINPYRIGVINILNLMGADITVKNKREVNNEPIADIQVKSSELKSIEIPVDQVPLAIDEFPALFIAAACAKGVTTLRQAEELRVKESDRIQGMATGLQVLGIDVETLPDGIRIKGGQIKGGRVNSLGDHRLAMSFAIAGLAAKEEIIVEDCANVATSFPNFVELASMAGLAIHLIEAS